MLNMLQNLYVKNLALIDETEVEFGEGLNILTGETGAGKSLLLGSVHLALGGKYSPDMLRNGTKSGLVELTFKIEDEQIKKHLEEMNLYPEDGFLTLSRRLMEGRSISKINGETVNTGILKDVASMLIDIHGQRDNQTLLHKKNHLTLLDLYGKEKIVPLKKKMAEMYRRWNELKKRTERLTMDEETRRRELSLAEFEAQDKKRKEGIDAKNEADSMVFQTENALNEVGDKIDANDKAAVQADIDALKAVIAEITDDQNITDAQIERLKNGKEKLMESSQKVFSKMYEQAQAQAGAQGAGPDMGAQGAYQDPNAGAGADDVVDGDYKEV